MRVVANQDRCGSEDKQQGFQDVQPTDAGVSPHVLKQLAPESAGPVSTSSCSPANLSDGFIAEGHACCFSVSASRDKLPSLTSKFVDATDFFEACSFFGELRALRYSRKLLVVDVEIGMYFLDVVEILEALHEL